MKFYLIGIKGSGMSALALYLLDLNYVVTGVDISEELFTEKELLSRGVVISNFDNIKLVDIKTNIVIYSSAYKDSEIVKYLKVKYPTFEYHEFLSYLLSGKKVIAISGTHGKTTACNMLDLILSHKTSLIEGDGVGRGNNSDYAIVEACEYKDHFLSYNPYISLVLPLTLDHTDYFHNINEYLTSFETFINQSKYCLIVNENKKYRLKGTYVENFKNRVKYKFIGINKCEVSYKIKGIKYPKVILPFNSKHEVNISLACLIIADKLKVKLSEALKELRNYVGPQRRMKIKVIKNDIFIDDYAHQPEQMNEVLSFINRVKEDRETILFYKPDRISRLLDFKNEFVKVFNKFDKVYLIPYHDINEGILKELISEKVNLYSKLKIDKDKRYVFAFLTSKSIIREIEQIKDLRKWIWQNKTQESSWGILV